MNKQGGITIKTFPMLIVFVVMYYVVVTVMATILDNLLFPQMDLVPTYGAIGKLILWVALYVLLPLGILLYAVLGEQNNQQQGMYQ